MHKDETQLSENEKIIRRSVEKVDGWLRELPPTYHPIHDIMNLSWTKNAFDEDAFIALKYRIQIEAQQKFFLGPDFLLHRLFWATFRW